METELTKALRTLGLDQPRRVGKMYLDATAFRRPTREMLDTPPRKAHAHRASKQARAPRLNGPRSEVVVTKLSAAAQRRRNKDNPFGLTPKQLARQEEAA